MRNTKLKSRKEYFRTLVFAWIFVIGWFAGLIALVIYDDVISTSAKYILIAILMILTPAGLGLFNSYKKYKKEWKEANEGPPYVWNDPVIGKVVEVIEPFSKTEENFTGLVILGSERWQAVLDKTGKLPQIGEKMKVVSRNGSILKVMLELKSA